MKRAAPEQGVQFGKYRLLRKLGEGAFGSVFEAVLPGPMGFSRRVAIKKLHPTLLRANPGLVNSLVDEARIGGLLHHVNIVDTLEFGQQGQDWYLAMEYVEGASLAELLRLCSHQRRLLPPFAVLDLAIQICRGLQHAHQLKDEEGRALNLVHRDLKPSNIMIDTAGTARISDFGIAKAESNLQSTMTAAAKGTPRYMSPEQISGESEISPQSDLFSLGAVIFEMVTCRPLFEADTLPALAHRIVYQELDEPLTQAEAALPGIGPLLERALYRDPAQRYADAQELADALRALAARYPPQADLAAVIAELTPQLERTQGDESLWQEEISTPQASRPRRWPLLLALLAGVLLVVLVAPDGILTSLLGPEPAPPALEREPAGAGAAPTQPAPPAEPSTEAAPEPAPAVEQPPSSAPSSTQTTPSAAPAPSAAPSGAEGTVSLFSMPWADIYLDGALLKSDVRLKRHPVSAGRHELKLICGNLDAEKTFVFDIDGQDLELGCWDFASMAPCGQD